MDSNKQIVTHYIEKLNKRNYSILNDLVADQVLVGENELSRDQYKQQILDIIEDYPDYNVEIIKMETSGDVVKLYWHRKGTKSSGEKLDEQLESEYTIKDGKIIQVN